MGLVSDADYIYLVESVGSDCFEVIVYPTITYIRL